MIKPKLSWLILPLLIFAFALRLYQLNAQALRGDEAATVLYAALPLSDLWELSRITDPHPPLFYALLHPWQALLGESAWVMRFVGVIASTLSVAALYALTQRTMQNIRLSLLAGLLLTLSPLQIWLAQDLRSYSLFTLLGLLSSMALWQAFQTPRPRAILLYIILTTASMYLHYYTIFLIAFHGLFALLNLRRAAPLLLAQTIIGLLSLPGLSLAYGFIGEAAGGIETIPLPQILRLTSTALLTGFTIDPTMGLTISLMLMPLWLLGLLSLLRRDTQSGSFWALFCLMPILGVIALSVDRPFFKERFLVQAQPAFCLLLAAGLLRLSHMHRYLRLITLLGCAALLLVNLSALTNYFFEPAYAKSKPWHFYHQYVSDHAHPGDVMLTNFPEAAVSYYSPNELPFYVVPEERDRSIPYRLERTAQIAAAYERIWFLPLLHQGFDEQGEVLQWLNRHGDRVRQVFFPQYNLNLYLSPPAINRLMIEQPATFAHGITLRGFQVLDEAGDSRLNAAQQLRLEPEAEFTLSLYWQAAQPTAAPYTVFVHLIAADGFNRTSRDNQPVWGSYPTTTWQPGAQITDKYTLTLPPGTPPDPHRLRLGWYHSETGARVPRRNHKDDFLILDMTVLVMPPTSTD